MNGVDAYQDLLVVWARRTKRSLEAHYSTARSLAWRNGIVGGLLIVASVVTTTLAGRNLFGFAASQLDSYITLSSALTLALASLHVFLRDGDRANQHKEVAAKYGDMKRRLELELTEIVAGGDINQEHLKSLLRELASLGDSAPGVPPRTWRRVAAKYPGEGEISVIQGA